MRGYSGSNRFWPACTCVFSPSLSLVLLAYHELKNSVEAIFYVFPTPIKDPKAPWPPNAFRKQPFRLLKGAKASGFWRISRHAPTTVGSGSSQRNLTARDAGVSCVRTGRAKSGVRLN